MADGLELKRIVDLVAQNTVDDTVYTIIDSVSGAVKKYPLGSFIRSVAPIFDSTTAYTAGQFCNYNGQLYQFDEDHAAGEWTGSDVSEITLSQILEENGEDISELKGALSGIEKKQIDDEVTLGAFKRTYTAKSQSSYTYYPFYLPEGNYLATATSAGDHIRLLDSSRNAVITIQKTSNKSPFSISAAQSASIVEMSMYQGSVTFEDNGGKLDIVDENAEKIESIDHDVLKYYTQFLTNDIRENGKYYSYNSQTGVISKYSVGTLSAFEFDLPVGTYHYYKLYENSYVKDLTTGVVTQLPNTSLRSSITIEHNSRAYISVPNSDYDVNSYFSDFYIFSVPTMPQGEFCKMLSDTLLDYVQNGEVHQYSFGSNGYKNLPMTINKGDAFTISFDQTGNNSVSIAVSGILANDSTEALVTAFYVGNSRYFTALSNYKGLQIIVSTPSSSGRFTITKHTKIGKLLVSQNTFYCGADREFTKLKDAIEKATQYMDSVLYVDAGEYDLVDEFGSAWFEALTSASTLSGLTLKNRIHIIFAPNSKVVCHYDGDNEYAQSLFSPFNAGEYGFTLENLTLECSRCRYAIHDERNGASEQYKSHYINCNVYIDNSENDYYSARCGIGGGLGSNAEVIVENCVWKSDDDDNRGGVYYHQSNKTTSTDYKSFVNIKNCWFSTGCVQIDDDRTGSQTGKTIYQVANNSFLKKYPNTNEQGVYDANVTSPTSELQAWNNVIRTT